MAKRKSRKTPKLTDSPVEPPNSKQKSDEIPFPRAPLMNVTNPRFFAWPFISNTKPFCDWMKKMKWEVFWNLQGTAYQSLVVKFYQNIRVYASNPYVFISYV